MNVAGKFATYTPATDNGSTTDSVSLIQVGNFLTRQWRYIALVTGLSIILGIGYIALSPSRYTAQADLIIDTKRMSWAQSQVATGIQPADEAAVESEIETTRSEKVAIAVSRQLQLTEDPEFVGTDNSLMPRISSLLRLGVSHALTDEEKTRRVLVVLKGNLRVTRLGRSYIEQIAYTSLDREKAARIANAFANAYIEDQMGAKFEATRRASVWLEARMAELRKQASDADKAVQDFKSENGIIISADGKLASDVELDHLGAALAKARADTSQAKAKFDRIQHVLEGRTDKEESLNIPDPVVTDALNNPVITKLRQQFLDDQSKESEWSARYGADHQAAQNLRTEMAALQRAIWDEISRIAESYRSEYQIAKTQEGSIDKRMTEVFQESGETRQKQVRLRELDTSAKTYRNIYENFLSQFTQSVQQQSFPSTEARIVTAATPPSSRSSPKTGLVLALATICGLGLGGLTGFLREQMSRRIHTRVQLESLLNTSCLAVLPALAPKRTAAAKPFSLDGLISAAFPTLGQKRAAAAKSFSLDGLINAALPALAAKRAAPTEPGEQEEEVPAFQKICAAAPFSATAEALRYIKVAIDLHPSEPKIIGIVSALPGEGKTTVSASIAAFIAKGGARTLLIDADLRNPSMTSALGYIDKPGLVELVADKTSFDDLVIHDSRYMFDFLPACTRVRRLSNSSDILNAAAVKQMLKTARTTYDYILVDLPPILPVVDVKATARLFDAFVLVVEWGSTPSDEIVKAATASPILSERLLGAVLNNADEVVMRRLEGFSERRYNNYYADEKIFPEADSERLLGAVLNDADEKTSPEAD